MDAPARNGRVGAVRKPYTAETLAEFVAWNERDGVRDDPEILALWEEATTAEQGAHHDNVMMKAQQGSARGYTLKRLKREQPELFEQVKQKRLSAHPVYVTGWRTSNKSG